MTVLFDKAWNIKCHAPFFRLHRLLRPISFSSELTREENSNMIEYWQEEVDRQGSMFWSYTDDRRKIQDLKMIPKTLIVRFLCYSILLLSGFMFIIVPT